MRELILPPESTERNETHLDTLILAQEDLCQISGLLNSRRNMYCLKPLNVRQFVTAIVSVGERTRDLGLKYLLRIIIQEKQQNWQREMSNSSSDPTRATSKPMRRFGANTVHQSCVTLGKMTQSLCAHTSLHHQTQAAMRRARLVLGISLQLRQILKEIISMLTSHPQQVGHNLLS